MSKSFLKVATTVLLLTANANALKTAECASEINRLNTMANSVQKRDLAREILRVCSSLFPQRMGPVQAAANWTPPLAAGAPVGAGQPPAPQPNNVAAPGGGAAQQRPQQTAAQQAAAAAQRRQQQAAAGQAAAQQADGQQGQAAGQQGEQAPQNMNRNRTLRERIMASRPNAGGARLDAPTPDLMPSPPPSLAGSHIDDSNVAASRRQETASARAPFIAGPEANEPVPAGMSGRPPAVPPREDAEMEQEAFAAQPAQTGGSLGSQLRARREAGLNHIDTPSQRRQQAAETGISGRPPAVPPRDDTEMEQEDFAAQPGQTGGSLGSQLRARKAAGLDHVDTPSQRRQQAAPSGQVDAEAEMEQEDFAAQPSQTGGSLGSQLRARKAAGLDHVDTPSQRRQQAAGGAPATDSGSIAGAMGRAIEARRQAMGYDASEEEEEDDSSWRP